MIDLPAPPVPAGCDLRDFPFYQVDVVRLRDSELVGAADAKVFRCAVLSWCYAWHQIPAGSLPNDDATLARALGFGRDVRGWKKVRTAGGLRGWYEANDGRLYHPVVAEKVNVAWRKKLEQRQRTEAARAARQAMRQTGKMSVTDDATESKGQGQCKGQGQYKGQGDSSTPPPGEPSRAGERENRTAAAAALGKIVEGCDKARVLASIETGNLLGVVAAYGANVDRGDEWSREASGFPIGEVAVVFDWAMMARRPIREPSGLRAELGRWKAFDRKRDYVLSWRKVMGLDQAQGGAA